MTSRAQRAHRAIARLAAAVPRAPDAEAALAAITAAALGLNGDREAHLRPGALAPGETQFFVAGCFLLSPDRSHHLLVAEQGFPSSQHRLRVPVDTGHPGRVYREQAPLLLANTDEHADFEQILETARMGSAIYAPMIWQGRFLGQVINAAQARNTMSEADLEVLQSLAGLATLAYVAHGAERCGFFDGVRS